MKTKFKDTEIGMIPEDWKVKRLGDCLDIVKKQFKPTKGDIRKYIGLEHIEQQSLKLISIGSSADVGSNKFEFKKDQILFGKLRPYFRKVYQPNFDGVCSTDMWVIGTEEGNDNSFFFYFLADERIINEANNSSEGTRMPRARWDYLEKLEYPIPSLNEQHAIAKILSDLDSKIELLQKQNKTLEAIGQAIFKQWFVDFEFPNEEGKPYKSSGGEMVFNEELGKEIPEGWEVEKLGEIVEITSSKRIFQSEYKKEGIPFFRSKEIIELYNGKNISLELFISLKRYNEIKDKFGVPKQGEVLLTSVGTIGIPYLIRKNDCFYFKDGNLTWFKNFKENFSGSYIYFWLISKNAEQQIKSISIGSTQKALTINGLSSLKVYIPKQELLIKCSIILNGIINKKENNFDEIQSIQKIRDSLLPKLMSGKIRVPVEVE